MCEAQAYPYETRLNIYYQPLEIVGAQGRGAPDAGGEENGGFDGGERGDYSHGELRAQREQKSKSTARSVCATKCSPSKDQITKLRAVRPILKIGRYTFGGHGYGLREY